MNTSTLFHLDLNDFAKGIVVAVLVAILGGIQQAFIGHGLDFGAFDWGSIFNLAVMAGMGYLTKNLITDSNGKILGGF